MADATPTLLSNASSNRPGAEETLKPPSVTEKTVSAMAKQLGMSLDNKAGTFASDPDKIKYTDGHLELTMYRASGGIRFIDRARWQVDDLKADLKIEDAAASRLAQNFVKKYQLAPGFILEITVKDNALYGQATNQPMLRLWRALRSS